MIKNWLLVQKQFRAQNDARHEAIQTGKPVDDGCGTRWYPPGKDGIVTISPSPTMEIIGRKRQGDDSN
jgi:hypothetical protein